MSVGLPSNRWELSYEANDAGPGQLGCRTGALANYIELLTHLIKSSQRGPTVSEPVPCKSIQTQPNQP